MPEEPVAPNAEPASHRAEPIRTNPLRDAYFGDLHVHTRYSFDAYLFGTRATPDDAYEFAKGKPIRHASGRELQLALPLDFLGVTDHAFYLGTMPAMADPDSPLGKQPFAEHVRAAEGGSRAAFNEFLAHIRARRAQPDTPDALFDAAVYRDAWTTIVDAAERHNNPGTFTTFAAYEYTSSGDEMENLHRNVVFADRAAALPFSALDSNNPEDLWDWLDEQRANGIEALAIPHNPNGSNGLMFALEDQNGRPLDAGYAEQRMRNEPVVENTQVKGTSDTHPLLSPNDEWADYEIMTVRVASTLPSRAPGSYVRDAYLNGLLLQTTRNFNPFRFGVIGSSDTHNAAGSFAEDDYWSKTGLLDIEPQQRGSVPLDEPDADGNTYANPRAKEWGASGLAGVWADANTRDAIYAAMRRKETFSTSGSRIRLRFFAGYGFSDDLVAAPGAVEAAYRAGVPMGSDLVPRDGSQPAFLTWALRAPDGAPLQRLQVIKGWVDNGERRERVFDIACSDGLQVDPKTHRCPDNGARVDLKTCAITSGRGAGELGALWRDPEFDPDQHAIYYVRVLENPICRWSTWDAIRAGVAPRPDMHATIQDRAWSSPIWYAP